MKNICRDVLFVQKVKYEMSSLIVNLEITRIQQRLRFIFLIIKFKSKTGGLPKEGTNQRLLLADMFVNLTHQNVSR